MRPKKEKLQLFVAALHAHGLQPDAEAVADFFFLASLLPRPKLRNAHAGKKDETETGSSTAGGESGPPPQTPPVVPETPPPPASASRKTGLYTPADETPQGTVPAEEIAVPEAPPLPGALEIARALRPFSVRYITPGNGVLDEDATAEQTAHGRHLILVFQPRRERWFDVALLVEDTPSMSIWRKDIAAFERMLMDHGAFRDVRRWGFTPTGDLRDPAGQPAVWQALSGPNGRRLILILTQGAVTAWSSSGFAGAVADWARRQPTAVIQVLPSHLWESTRLGAPKALATCPKPGLPNAQWDLDLTKWMRLRIPDGVAIPILAMHADSLGRWANMLMSRLGDPVPSVFWSAAAASPCRQAVNSAVELSPKDRLDGFRRIATEDGFRLAVGLAAGPVTLPILRVVNHTLFGESARQETMAQVLLGGLLRKAKDHADADSVYYDFHPGVRDLLARQLNSDDRFSVRRMVFQYLRKHPDTTHYCRALVPHADGKRMLPEWAMPFAEDDQELLQKEGLLRKAADGGMQVLQGGTPAAFIAFFRGPQFADRLEPLAQAMERAGYRVARVEKVDSRILSAVDAVVQAGPVMDTDWNRTEVFASGKPVLTLTWEIPSETDLLQRIERLLAGRGEFGPLYNFPELPVPYLQRKELEDRLADLLVKGNKLNVGVQGAQGTAPHTLINAMARRDDVRRAFRGGIFWDIFPEAPSALPRLWIGHMSSNQTDRCCVVVDADGDLIVPLVSREEAVSYLEMRNPQSILPRFDDLFPIHEGDWHLLDLIGNMLAVCNPAVLVQVLRDRISWLLAVDRQERSDRMLDPARHALEDAPNTFLRLISGCRSNRVPEIVWTFMEKQLEDPLELEKLVRAHFVGFGNPPLFSTSDMFGVGSALFIPPIVFNAFSGQVVNTPEVHALILKAYLEASENGQDLDDGYFRENLNYHLERLSPLDRTELAPMLANLQPDPTAIAVLYNGLDRDMMIRVAAKLRDEGIPSRLITSLPAEPRRPGLIVAIGKAGTSPTQLDAVTRLEKERGDFLTLILPGGPDASLYPHSVSLPSLDDQAAYDLLKQRLRTPVLPATPHIVYISYAFENSDVSLVRFVRELAAELAGQAGLPASDERVVFVERVRGPLRGEYAKSIERELASSTVLLCVTSPAYFASEVCGKEYAFFEAKIRSAEPRPPLIIPLIWIPTQGGMPAPINEIQHFRSDSQKRGMHSLVAENQPEYRAAVTALASRIVERWQQYRNLPPPAIQPELESLPNPFAPPLEKPQNFILVAGSQILPTRSLDPATNWAAEAIGREAARQGFGLVAGVEEGVDLVTVSAFVKELKRQQREPRDFLRFVTFKRSVPAWIAAMGTKIHFVEDSVPESLKRAEAVVLLGGDYWVRQIYEQASAQGIPVFPIRGTRQAAAEIFDQEVNAFRAHGDLGWSRTIDLQEDAQAVAAALFDQINATPIGRQSDMEWIRQAIQTVNKLGQKQPREALEVLRQRRDLWESTELRPILKEVIEALFRDYARRYEEIRETQPRSNLRTGILDGIMTEAIGLGQALPIDRALPPTLFQEGQPGARIIGIGAATAHPQPEYMAIATAAIIDPQSRFEQFQALRLASKLVDGADAVQCRALRGALLSPKSDEIPDVDSSRGRIKAELLAKLGEKGYRDPKPAADWLYPVVEIVPSADLVFDDDPGPSHGPFVKTRGKHRLTLPPRFYMGTYPVTNRLFVEFIWDNGYQDRSLWSGSTARFLTRDRVTQGPSTWMSSSIYPPGADNHPVAGISFFEAAAFVRWLQRRHPVEGRMWCLPTEDMWELAARSTKGFRYPWGNEFQTGRCNSAESRLGTTSDISQFSSGVSAYGCLEMAGNVWEFVVEESTQRCILRGGGFKNNQDEVSSHFRLESVARDQRPADFGFRCAQVLTTGKPVSKPPIKTPSLPAKTKAPPKKRALLKRKK